MKIFIAWILLSFMLNPHPWLELRSEVFTINKLHSFPFTKDARKLAEYYRQRVIRGESMSNVAKLYSEDPGSAQNGGRYDNIVRGMMVPKFDEIAFNLKPNEISEVFETKFGFHFIQLISRKGDVLSLRHVLITKN